MNSIAKHSPCIKSNNHPSQHTHNIQDNLAILELERNGHINIPLAQVIRKKCLDCCVSQVAEVRKCESIDCALWPYRMGKNPFQSAKYKMKQEG